MNFALLVISVQWLQIDTIAMKQEACSQILYFLFRDLERAYESKNRGGFIDYKRKEGRGGERRKKTVYGHHWSNVIGIANAEVIMTSRWHWEGHFINLVLPKDVHRHSFPFFLARCQILGEKKPSVGRLWNKGKWFFSSKFSFFLYHKLTDPQADQAFLGDSPLFSYEKLENPRPFDKMKSWIRTITDTASVS